MRLNAVLICAALACNKPTPAAPPPAPPSLPPAKAPGGSLSAASKPQPELAPRKPEEPREEDFQPRERALLRIVNAMMEKDRMKEFYNACVTSKLRYADLKKNPDRFAFKHIYARGRLLEVHEENGKLPMTTGRIDLNEWRDEPIAFVMFGHWPHVEGDYVEIIGLTWGSYSYTSQAGWEITIPGVAVGAMTKPGKMKAEILRRSADIANEERKVTK